MTVKWFGKEVLEETTRVMAMIEKEIAEDVMADAKKILEQKADKTTADGLLSQFYVEPSKFKNGGYLVWCQGPKKWHPPYHASYIELGTHKTRNMEAKPFMRPGLKKNKRSAKRKFQEALDGI